MLETENAIDISDLDLAKKWGLVLWEFLWEKKSPVELFLLDKIHFFLIGNQKN